jgi:hypothetical protein
MLARAGGRARTRSDCRQTPATVFENLALKHKIVEQMESVCKESCIIAVGHTARCTRVCEGRGGKRACRGKRAAPLQKGVRRAQCRERSAGAHENPRPKPDVQNDGGRRPTRRRSRLPTSPPTPPALKTLSVSLVLVLVRECVVDVASPPALKTLPPSPPPAAACSIRYSPALAAVRGELDNQSRRRGRGRPGACR